MAKLKTFVLGAAMAASSFLVSCKDTDTENQTTPAEKARTEEQIRKQQREMYYEFVFDSLKTANGEKKIEEQLRSHQSRYDDEDDIHNLRHQYSLGGVMEHEVSTKGTKIIENAYQQIVAELGKYGVKLDNYIGQHPENPDYIALKKRYSWGDEVLSKYGLSFIGVSERVYKDSQDDYYDDAAEAWDDLVSVIYTAINEAVCSDGEPYGENQKNNMKAAVDAIVAKTKNSLIASREAVEQKYSDYYLVSEDNRKYLGTSYWAEGDFGYGYDDLNGWMNSKYLAKHRSIDVYDSNLNVEFFGDKDATYKLVSLGDGKWQVVKTYSNGKTEKTHVFTDAKTFYESFRPSDEAVRVGTSEFDFEAGRNMGVRVYWDEIVEVQQRKKDWNLVIPQETQRKIDSLTKEMENKEALFNSQLKKLHEADSIAEQMAIEKYGVLTR